MPRLISSKVAWSIKFLAAVAKSRKLKDFKRFLYALVIRFNDDKRFNSISENVNFDIMK
jgi:hypothetical protein